MRRDVGELEGQWASFAEVVTVPERAAWHVNGPARGADAISLARLSLPFVTHRPDLVYVHAREHMFGGALIAGLARCPAVAHLHDPAWSARKQDRWAFKRTDRFIAVSRAQADDWIETGIDAARTLVVHNGVDLDRFTPSSVTSTADLRAGLGLPLDRPVVGFIGRIVPDKGVHVLLQAVNELRRRQSPVCVALAGDADRDDETRRYFREEAIGTNDGIVFLGQLADPRDFYRAADVVALPSIVRDSFPLTALEAMACGTPVVAARIGGLPEALLPEFPDQLVTSGDAVELADALQRYVRWRDEAPDLGLRSRRHVERRFSAHRSLELTEAAVVGVLSRQRRA